MKLEELIELIYEFHVVEYESNLDFPRIVEKLPEKMKMQESDIDGIEHEWVYQTRDPWDSYSGALAYQLEDGRFLIFGFYGC